MDERTVFDNNATSCNNQSNCNKDENTSLDTKQTQSETQHESTTKDSNKTESEATKENKGSKLGAATAMGVGAGVVGGILLGTLNASAEPIDGQNLTVGQTEDNYEWIDDSIDIATSVNDTMSFDEAFAAARAEVGPGGAFEWRGGIYGTFYAEEWANMSDEEKAEYNAMFHWDDRPQYNNEPLKPEPADPESSDETTAQVLENGEVLIEDNELIDSTTEDLVAETIDDETENVITADTDPEFEVLGVEQGDLQAMVDDEEIHLIDIDNDGDINYTAETADIDDMDLLANNTLPGDDDFIDYISDNELA